MLTKSITIPKHVQKRTAEDYEYLRQKGLERLQELSGKIWTDYNIHDPGLTILELLCYAITDLGYRTSFDINDLLTQEGKEGPDRTNAFFTPKEILTTQPVTINDYRKLLLDKIPALRNVWLYTNDEVNYTPAIYYNKKKDTLTNVFTAGECEALQLKGLYTIVFELEQYDLLDKDFLKTIKVYRDKTSTKTSEEVEEDELESVVRNMICTLMQITRNLCEDVYDIRIMQEERVALCADIELHPTANSEKVWKEIYRQLFDYINPPISLYSLQELLDKGKRMEDIFQGSVAERGFIDYDELEQFNNRTVLYTSDIINLIMDIPGVKAIRTIHLSSYIRDTTGAFKLVNNAEPYCLHLSDPTRYAFKLALDFDEEDKNKQFNHIHFYKDHIYFSPKHKADYRINDFVNRQKIPTDFSNDLALPKGRYRQTEQYFSIQNEFPAAYLLGQEGVPSTTDAARRGQRLQLKAYLIFFEQLLANYLAQLSGLTKLFSWQVGTSNQHTYFYTDLINSIDPVTGKKEISDIEKVLATYKSTVAYQETLETKDAYFERKNRFLDHLLARFNEQFIDYSLFKFSQDSAEGFYNSYSPEEMLKGKSALLKNYPVLSSQRTRALDYSKPVTTSNNISGLELRMNHILGIERNHFKPLVKILETSSGDPLLTPEGKIQVCDNRTAAFQEAFGLHLLEHILLRPQSSYDDAVLLNLCKNETQETEADGIQPDQYSLNISVVLPGWLAIAGDTNWREFVEHKIRQEAPAHIGLKICWISPVQMYRFEKAYTRFMQALGTIKDCTTKPDAAALTAYYNAMKEMINVLKKLKNTYPPSALENCNDIEFDEKGNMKTRPVILNHTALAAGGDEDYVFVNC